MAQWDNAEQIERISRWCLGGTASAIRAQEGPAGKTGADALEGARQLLTLTAKRLLDEGNLYNAAKHGLAVLPEQRSMKFVFEDSPIDLSVEGASLSYLETRPRTQGGSHAWHESTTWVNTDSWLGWTHLVLKQMRSIWAVGKLVYREEPAHIDPVFPEWIDGVTKLGAKEDFNIEAMRMQLRYYVARPPTG